MNGPDALQWRELCLVLAAGSSALVLVAALACRMTASPRQHRAAWQMALLGVAALLMVELSGMGAGFTAMIGDAWRSSPLDKQPAAADAAIQAHNGLSPGPEESLASDVLADPAEHSSAAADLSQLLVIEPIALTELSTLGADITSRAAVPAELLPAEAPPPPLWWPAWIWGTGTLLLVGRIACGQWLLVRFVRRHRQLAGSETARRVATLAARLGIRRRVRCMEAACLESPIAFGTLRPTIGLPRNFESFTQAEQEAMLAHELAHLAGHDAAWRLACDAVAACLWWQPLVWWMRSQLQAASEAAADEASLLVENGPSALAECLVLLARSAAQPHSGRSRLARLRWLSVQGSGFRSSLARRVQRLIVLKGRWRPPRRLADRVVRWGGAAALVIAVLLITAGARSQPPHTGEPAMTLMRSSWQRSLAGLVVVAALGPTTTMADDQQRDDPPRAERREEGERREEAQRRDGERRDAERPQGAREEDRERPDRPRGEADRERPDRPQAERRDAPDRPRGEGGPPRPDAERRDRDRPEAERRPEPPRGEGPGPRPPLERARLEEQLSAMQRELARLAEAGRKDEAERVERAIRELRERLEAISRGDRAPIAPPRPGEPRGEPGRRGLDALRAAIANLRAAGKNELANELEAEARRAEGERPDQPREPGRAQGEARRPDARGPEGRGPEGRGPEARGPEGRGPLGPGRGPEGAGRGPDGPPGELMNVLREMRNEIQNLRNEVNELRNRVRELSPKEGR